MTGDGSTVRLGRPELSEFCYSPLRGSRGERPGNISGTGHRPGQCGGFAATVADQLDVGCEQLRQVVDVSILERPEEPRRQLFSFPAIGLEPRAPDGHMLARSHHELSAGRLGTADGVGNLSEPEANGRQLAQH